ncbi:mannitol dehydrogenase family protein [Streptomyces sp. NPDC005423]|uniref:mannitol dehydrogenase family protein n=1 Tax=Streptomyces sp. NPDC005423 TaxID=3155343 RepID=UPI0033A6E355
MDNRDTSAYRTAALPAPDYRARPLGVGIVHVGVGGFHRSHQAVYTHELMRRGLADDWAILGVGTRPDDVRMHQVLTAQNGCYVLEIRAADGSRRAEVIGSLVGHLQATDDPDAVVSALTDPAVRIVTLTITEGGYDESAQQGGVSVFGLLSDALAARWAAGTVPFTVVSCDNIQHNGQVARRALTTFAAGRDPELAAWIESEVAFPSSMVDRITPATTPSDVAAVREHTGWADEWPVVAEPFTQWVLEDRFPAGRPPWEEVGVQLVEDVAPYEKLKLRILNGAHQAIAYAGLLLGHRMVHEAAADTDVRAFVRGYLKREATGTLDRVPGIDVPEYVETVLGRFTNPAIADTLERLAVAATDRIGGFVIPVALDLLRARRPAPGAGAVVALWQAAGREAERAGFVIADGTTARLVADDAPTTAWLDASAPADPLVRQLLPDVERAADLLRTSGPRGLLRGFA